MKYLFIDTETGGIDPQKHSLLSIAFVVWSEENGIENKLELFVKSEKYVFTKEASRINRFDYIDHNIKALSQKKVILKIKEFLGENFNDPKNITVIGHNIQFDVNFLRYFFKRNGYSFMKLISHRMIDTNSIIKYLIIANVLPNNISNLSDALRHFVINVEQRHSALNDCIATVKLFEDLIRLQNR